MSDIQYVQRPFQQFCTKTISICPSCSTQLKLCSTNNHPCSPFSKKITIHVHYVPRQITMFPAFFQNKPQVFQHVSMNLQETSTVSTNFPACSNHFPTIPFKNRHFPPKNANFPRIFPAPAVPVLPPRHCPKALAAWRSSRTPSCLASRCFSKAVARLLKRGSLVHGEMVNNNGDWSENGDLYIDL